MFRAVLTIVCVACVSILAGTTVVTAQEVQDCLFCHAEPDSIKETDDGKVISLYVDEATFAKSVHGTGGCVSCHVGIDELPHADELELVDCGVCHEVAEVYAKSLHGQALLNGDKDAAVCHDCHSKHDIRHTTDLLSPVHPGNLAQTCGQCHSDPALVKRHMVSVVRPSDSYLKSVHGKAILRKGIETAAACNDCHGTHDILPSHNPNSPVYRFNIATTCGQCHVGVTREFAESIHGQALEAGIKDAPTCIDCHGEHDIESHLLDTSSVSLQQVSRVTCPRCHDDERVMSRYGIATMRQASYMDSYHGMASAAGSRVVASCTSCHGVHDILSRTDPNSAVYIDNLPTTCGKCHEGASEHFAMGPVHIIPTDPDQWALGMVRLLYIVLIILVCGGLLAHNTLMMARQAFTKFKQELRGPNTYRRFNRGLTIGHMILTVSFVALAVSGFALRYPESWWTQLIFVGERGLVARSIVHRIAAVVMVALTIINVLYLVGTRGGRKELRHLSANWKDFKDLFQNVAYALGFTQHRPRFDRYSYIEKFEYWGMWWGTAIMIVTGLCMWFVDLFLTYLPKLALDVVALVHFYEAWLAVLAIVIWHLYYMIFDPETYPMNWSWITGYITEEDFKERHPIEYEREVHSPHAEPNAPNMPSED